MVLPPKSVLCMPCHAATLSFGDTTTIISLVIFGLGLVLFSSVWLGGDWPAAPDGMGYCGAVRFADEDTSDRRPGDQGADADDEQLNQPPWESFGAHGRRVYQMEAGVGIRSR